MQQISPARRRLFAVITLGLPLLLLLGLEGALRLAGYGSGYPLFVETGSSEGWLRMNPFVGHRYFSEDAIVPGVTRDPFREGKTPETIRLVVQGGSSALGYPYFYGGAFPRMLERRLERTFPERPLEVVNTAMTAVNSYTLLDFADEIVAIEPDAVLIYAGHNEYYGALGVGSSQSVGRRRPVVRAYLALRRLRTVQLLRAALAGLRSLGPAPEAGARTQMERMVGERTIPYGSPLYERGVEQFRSNLAELLARYRRAGIPVFVATLVSNERDQPPFIGRPDPDVPEEAWESAVAGALSALERGEVEVARAELADVAARDSANAALFYAAARRLDAAGAPSVARELYQAAKDRDQLRFRAPEAMNAVIREAAREAGARVVDVQAAFAAASPAGIPGSGLITEHLHPRLHGYFLLADAFYDALREAGALAPWKRVVPAAEAREDPPYTAVDSLYGELQVLALTAGWPFRSDPEAQDRVLAELRSPPEGPAPARIAHALFHRRLSWPEAMDALYRHHLSAGEPREAARAARALVQEFPDLAAPYELWATAVMRAGEPEEAVRAMEEADAIAPSHRTAALLGSALLGAGRREAALVEFERAARLAPSEESVPRAALAAARALPRLERTAAERPTDPEVLYALADAYAAVNHVRRAREVLRRLLEVDAAHAEGRRLLEQLEATGDRPASGIDPAAPSRDAPPTAAESRGAGGTR